MRLTIEANMEKILEQWDEFAETLYPAPARTNAPLLRDHARQILEAVVKDLATPQSDAQQSEKSKGRAPHRWSAVETAAQTHAVLRAESGIDINQLAAEYRALRASVLRFWKEDHVGGLQQVEELIRFNEAIDQALAESISFFTAEVERSRNLLLGMLGHDMRTPLNAIVMTASAMSEADTGAEILEAADILLLSGASMKALLDDLVDFNRTKLGLGIKITLRDEDLGLLFADEVKQHRAAHPTREVVLTVDGEVHGRWDGLRLQQVLRNLVSNACVYGTKEKPIRVALHGDAEGVHFEVMNSGQTIDPETAAQLFNPLQRGDLDSSSSYKEGMGLGLYIVSEIVQAHGGTVNLRSEAGETSFTVRLPRKTAA